MPNLSDDHADLDTCISIGSDPMLNLNNCHCGKEVDENALLRNETGVSRLPISAIHAQSKALFLFSSSVFDLLGNMRR